MPPLDFPTSPTVNQLFPTPPTAGVPAWKWDGAKWVATAGGIIEAPQDGEIYGRRNAAWVDITNAGVAFFFTGKPAVSGSISIPLVSQLVVPANLAGSSAYPKTAASASTVFTVNKIAVNLTVTAIGTITVTGSTATFAGAGATLLVGEVLQIVAPATQDATLADLGITILVKRP